MVYHGVKQICMLILYCLLLLSFSLVIKDNTELAYIKHICYANENRIFSTIRKLLNNGRHSVVNLIMR